MKPATILLVEDDRPILEGISDLLSVADIGYELTVDTAENGVEALDRLENRRPDLIISDIMMPRMDGYELLSRVRDNPEWGRVPVILATARGEKDDIHRGRTSGAQLYITKPFNTSQLLELIKSQLDRQFQLLDSHKNRWSKESRNILKMVNHEFRTPLTFVNAYFEILADSVAQFEDPLMLQEYLQGIQRGCIRLNRLVDDLITVMDLRTGRLAQHIQSQTVTIDDLAERLRDRGAIYAAKANEKAIEFHASIPANLPPIQGDPDRLLDAVARLLSNAVKFTHYQTGAERRIDFTAGETPDSIEIVVRDTGIGFPAHLSEQIFDFLFQYNREYFEQQGSGSGLAIARGIVQLHGGTITAGGNPGTGAEFRMTLPLKRSTGGGSTESLTRAATVLAVEDEENLLYGLRELLEISDERYVMTVITATNGQEGLERLRAERPDLIISDIMMPVMDGYDFLRAVRQNPDWVQIPFIFLTAKGERTEIHRGYSSGVEEYITKPYNYEELLDLIHTQLERHFEVQSLYNHDFEELKRSILALLQPNFKQSVSAVNTHSRDLAQMLLGDKDGAQAKLTEAETTEDLRESLQGIHLNSQQLTRQVENFIALAELQAGEARKAFNLKAQVLHDLGPILYSGYEQFCVNADLEGITIEADLVPVLPLIYGDYDDLIACQNRLLGVARQLCLDGKGAHIVLESSHDEDAVLIAVTCDGSGFGGLQQSQIGSLLNGNNDGALELATYGTQILLTKEHVHLHGGELMFDSDGGWHTFTMRLPVHREV